MRRRTCHSKIKTYDEFNSEDAFGRVVFNFIKPGRTWHGYQDLGKSVAGDDRSGKPEKVNSQEEQILKISSWEMTQQNLSIKYRNQVRIRQKRMSDNAEDCTEHSIVWGMFMAATMSAATFMGKNFSTIQSFIMNSEDFTLKQMFDSLRSW